MKKIITYIVIILVVLSTGYFSFNYFKQKAIYVGPIDYSFITVKQSINDGSTGEAEYINKKIDLGSTALDLLKKTAEVKIKGEGENAFVTSINGKEAKSGDNEYWSFNVNGKPATVGAGSYKLKDKDKIEWKIEKY